MFYLIDALIHNIYKVFGKRQDLYIKFVAKEELVLRVRKAKKKKGFIVIQLITFNYIF